jgi:hypothetical protein
VRIILSDPVFEVRAKDQRMLVLKRPKFPKDGDDELFDPAYPV